jgi:hypothetical protein
LNTISLNYRTALVSFGYALNIKHYGLCLSASFRQSAFALWLPQLLAAAAGLSGQSNRELYR